MGDAIESQIPAIYCAVYAWLLLEYGELAKAPDRKPRDMCDAVVIHFMNCTDALALDFLEILFLQTATSPFISLVDWLNNIFQDEGLGYELTPYREVRPDPDGPVITEHPVVICRDTEFLHSQVVRPCLEVLSADEYQTAHSEMMKAHEAYRRRHYEEAITDACSAFESTLKTICSKKGWPYDPDKDTLSTLVKVCNTNSLFPPFYVPMFEAVGTLRNKMSDAHGRGPRPLHTVGKEHADHMIQMVSCHITFIVRRAQ